MPRFECVGGGEVFIPAGRILEAESGEGGLTSTLRFLSPVPGKVAQVEVNHTVRDVSERVVDELVRVGGSR